LTAFDTGVLTVVTRRLFVLLAILAAGGCALDKQKAPGLTGPSEMGLSLRLTASPDIVSWDGVSQSVIEISATDASGQPVRGLTMRVETAEGGAVADIGTLSARTISTNNDGRASVTFTAPPAPPPTAGTDAVVNVVVTPFGTDYQNSTPRTVALRLARPGVILPPNGVPVPMFFFSPSAPRQFDTVQFDASLSKDDGQIVSYVWTFGDGTTATGVRPTKQYDTFGQFTVVLTVTDDRGLTASSDPVTIIVSAATDPTASFVYSPTDPAVGTRVFVSAALSKAAPGRTIVQYEWNFGDGTPIQFGETQEHFYTQPHTYTITLRVTDNTGRTASVSQTIKVE
jgi:PKD repeat protein